MTEIESYMKIVLTLCIPTYNRGYCIKEQIERLHSCPKNILDMIEIIISDNCSTDDTQYIVETAIENGFNCRYIRNSINVGMDANFINCAKNAKGRYVWVLGDDDIIIIDSLVRIVKILDVPQEYGLLHIYQKNNLYSNIAYINDTEQMIKYVSYFITYISANIVNAKYISHVDLEKYQGTWFALVPLYITALKATQTNVILRQITFEAGKDYINNGGYNFFKVFIINYLSIINEFIANKKLRLWLKYDIWPYIWTYTRMLLIKKDIRNYSLEQGWYILFRYYGLEWYFWKSIIGYPFIVIIRKLKCIINK